MLQSLDHALTEAQPSPRPGWLRDIDLPLVPTWPRCAEFCGYAVHAQASVPAADRAALERLLKYGLRAPLSTERLQLLDAGRVVRYRFARSSCNGRGPIDLEPVALLRRLALLIPPPRQRLATVEMRHRTPSAGALPFSGPSALESGAGTTIAEAQLHANKPANCASLPTSGTWWRATDCPFGTH